MKIPPNDRVEIHPRWCSSSSIFVVSNSGWCGKNKLQGVLGEQTKTSKCMVEEPVFKSLDVLQILKKVLQRNMCVCVLLISFGYLYFMLYTLQKEHQANMTISLRNIWRFQGYPTTSPAPSFVSWARCLLVSMGRSCHQRLTFFNTPPASKKTTLHDLGLERETATFISGCATWKNIPGD